MHTVLKMKNTSLDLRIVAELVYEDFKDDSDPSGSPLDELEGWEENTWLRILRRRKGEEKEERPKQEVLGHPVMKLLRRGDTMVRVEVKMTKENQYQKPKEGLLKERRVIKFGYHSNFKWGIVRRGH